MRSLHPTPRNESLLNKLVLAMAVIEPTMTAPQVYDIWVKRQTSGVSLLTWSFFTFAAVIWLLYGVKLKSVPLIVAEVLWIIFQTAVVLGLLLVGGQGGVL